MRAKVAAGARARAAAGRRTAVGAASSTVAPEGIVRVHFTHSGWWRRWYGAENY